MQGESSARSIRWRSPDVSRLHLLVAQEWGFSEEASFVTPPAPGPETVVKVLAVADMGQAEADGALGSSAMVPSLNTTRLMRREIEEAGGYSLLLHNGDISYAR